MENVESGVEGKLKERIRRGIGSQQDKVSCNALDNWEVSLMNITPEVAERWMKMDKPGNRPIRQRAVDEYSRDMESDRWDLPVAAIAFDDTGHLTNGRHRLLAIMKSGKTVPSIVLIGKNTVVDIDSGISRSAGDFFHLMGVSAGNRMAASARWVAFWEINRLASKLTIKWSTAELWAVWDRHPKLQESAAFIMGFENSSLTRIGRVSLLIAFHYLYAMHDRVTADLYFDGLITADNIRKTDPVALVRNKFLDARAEERHRRINDRHWAMMLTKGWNATVQGRAIKALRVGPDEKFPPIRTLPEDGDDEK